jgi:hypothetical protein
MKAFHVRYDVAGSKGLSEILLVENEKDLETALEKKSPKRFKSGDGYSNITVKIGELSISKFLLLKNM